MALKHLSSRRAYRDHHRRTFQVYHTPVMVFWNQLTRMPWQSKLAKRGLLVRRKVPVDLFYEGVSVGTYRVDLLVEDKIIVEVKPRLP